ncbi:MAG: tryptophan--tRNA ligase [Chloroflexi bacterium]|nr:tryptophan--tRNA ligase [Chloroflexota bacterium]
MNGRPRVLSGIQPSGRLHIGNYLGAIQQWVLGQDAKDNFFCIVDLHAITVPQDPDQLRLQTRQTAAILLAAGIDPKKSTLFVQSHVRAHAEACWILNCLTPLGWLERMTQYKSKAANQETVSTGLLNYPVLMAADILLYDADEVPVGDDQRQHVELTRDIAVRFNHIYGDFFVVPKAVIREEGARVMGLDDPNAKMSKSGPARGHAVGIVDEPDEIRYTLGRAVTDSGREIQFSSAPEKAGVNNLLQIYLLMSGKSAPEVERNFEGRGYGDLKKAVTEVVIESLRPIRERYAQLMQEPDDLDRLLATGAAQARALAEPKVLGLKERVGFVLPTTSDTST